jgi:hypothetical protein
LSGIPAIPHHDAALIALVDRLQALNAECDRLNDIEQALTVKLRERHPTRSAVLQWRTTDPVTYESESFLGNKNRLWCSRKDIEAKRHVPITSRQFIGTDADWEEHFEVPAMWAEAPDEAKQKRFTEIVVAHDAYCADIAWLRAELGLDEAKDRANAAFDRYAEVVDELLAAPATTLEGLRAKASAVFACCWSGDRSFFDNKDPRPTAERLMRSMVRDLITMDFGSLRP